MPSFQNDDIDIDVEDFFDEMLHHERLEMFDLLKEYFESKGNSQVDVIDTSNISMADQILIDEWNSKFNEYRRNPNLKLEINLK